MGKKASFIGLGNMGAAMAASLLKHGVDVAVYNRSKEKAANLVKAGAKLLSSPREAFQHGPMVLSMVANDQALHDISEGPHGLLAGAKAGCIHISMSTVAPSTTQELAQNHQRHGVQLLAAPVFGRPDVAAKQALWICLAGDETAKKQAEPFLAMIGQKTYDFGSKPESANRVKLAGNMMILSIIELLGEVFAFAEKGEIDTKQFLTFLTDSMYPSPVFKTYGNIILQKAFEPAGFKMNLGLKDVNLFLDAAKEVQATSPIVDLLHEKLLESIAKGREEMDWSAITMLS